MVWTSCHAGRLFVGLSEVSKGNVNSMAGCLEAVNQKQGKTKQICPTVGKVVSGSLRPMLHKGQLLKVNLLQNHN